MDSAYKPTRKTPRERGRASRARGLMGEVDKHIRLMEAVTGNTRACLVYLDSDFNFIWVNQAYADVCARTREEFIGHNHFEFYPNEENEAIFKQVRDTGVTYTAGEKPFVFPDHPEWGVTYWDWTLTPIASDSGAVEALVFSLVDVTEDLTTRHEIQRLTAEASALLDAARAVLKHRKFSDAARVIFDSCKVLLGATAGYVALLSEDGAQNEVLFLDSGGLPCSVDPTLPMPVRGLVEQAYRTGRVVCCNTFTCSDWAGLLPDGHVALDNVLFAPLAIEGRVAGVLALANKPGGFTDNDTRTASAFGELAAVTLSNSRTLESLERSEQRFRSVAQTANDAIISGDSKGRIMFWNHGAAAIFGYTPNQVTGKPLTIIMPERFRRAHTRGLKRFLSTGQPRVIGRTVEMVGLRKDGAEFPLELSLASWKMGDETYFTAIVRDISERKSAAEVLRKERDFTSAILNTQGALVVVLDREGRIVNFNRACEQTTGYTFEEVKGRCFWDILLVPEEIESVKHVFGELRAGQYPNQHENCWIGKDGRCRLISWSNTALVDAGGMVINIVATGIDVTERKQVERALMQTQQKLEKAYEREHRIADVLQRSLIPDVNAELPGYRIVASYRPALQEAEVGGDFYDVFTLSDGRLAMVMGDVSGKGLQAAGHTAMAKYMLRAYAHEDPEPASVLGRLNHAMCSYVPDDLFVTLLYVVLDPAARTLTCGSAGHDDPLLYRRSLGWPAPVDVSGRAAGVLPRTDYDQITITLGPGDILLAYTDGITEARLGGRFFGLDGLTRVLLANADHDVRPIMDAVFDAAVEAGGGDLRDDAAVMVLKVNE